MKEWSMNVLQWVRHRWIVWMTSLEHIGDTNDGLVALTPKMDGVMDQWWGPVNRTTQPGMDAKGKCHVQERLATNKVSSSFLPNFPQSLLTSTSLFLSSLRRITYACSIIRPSGNLLLYFSESSDSETHSHPVGWVCRYLVLTSLTTKITRSLSILESLKEMERRLQRFVFVI